MKLLRTLTLLLTGASLPPSPHQPQKTTEPVAYRLVDSVGRPVTFDKLITRTAGADVVFFGELHNNPISHWMQLRVLEALQQRKGKNLTLGLEMLEADIQLILDEYLTKTISPRATATRHAYGRTMRRTTTPSSTSPRTMVLESSRRTYPVAMPIW